MKQTAKFIIYKNIQLKLRYDHLPRWTTTLTLPLILILTLSFTLTLTLPLTLTHCGLL